MSPARHLFMFDIDDTLVHSYQIDTNCLVAAVEDVMQITINTDWTSYEHVTDAGILHETMCKAGVSAEDTSLVAAVKERFLSHLSRELVQSDFGAVAGASEFLLYLVDRSDVKVSLATGGWSESALLKLQIAGIDAVDLPMGSSSDHFSRKGIMKISEQRAFIDATYRKHYFGDGPWDQEAAVALGYNFILVGDRINWSPSIMNYKDIESILSRAGLDI